jgi:hypothetical protein
MTSDMYPLLSKVARVHEYNRVEFKFLNPDPDPDSAKVDKL